jgi:RNA polymerase sigma-70 factor (ECF subfamily)
MSAPPDRVNRELQRFQAFLECLTAIHVSPRLRIDPQLRSHFGWSEVINETLLDASRNLERIRAMPEPDQERWLRTMLANNLVDRIRKELARANRPNLGPSLDQDIEESSCRAGAWVPVDESTPSEILMRQERALQLADALARLPEQQREVLILRTWHGKKLAEIAEQLHCTIGVVAGHERRAREALKTMLPADLLEEP